MEILIENDQRGAYFHCKPRYSKESVHNHTVSKADDTLEVKA